MKNALFGATLVLSLVCLVSTVSAAEDERYALVIGNAAYEGDAQLANPVNDAGDMATALASIGWKVTKLVNGDRKAMNRTIAQFRDALSGSRNATALLFYAGHGIQINGGNYLIPIGETFETVDDVQNDAISLQTILNAFDDAKVATNIVILDACRDNPFVKKNTRSLGGTRGLSVVSKSTQVEGSAVLFSTAPGDTAADGTGRNGVFTQALLKYITDPSLTLQQVATKVTGEVKRVTGNKQTPYSSLSLSDDYWMVPASLRTTEAPATAAAVPTVTAVAAPVVTVDTTSAQKASLIVQRNDLLTEKKKVQETGGVGGLIGIIGWSTAIVGAGLAGYTIYQGPQTVDAYQSAKTQSVWSAKREEMNLLNLLWKVGLGATGAGLGLGVSSFFLGPDTSSIDKKIQEVDQKITLLGGK